jgi:hypothetical protein
VWVTRALLEATKPSVLVTARTALARAVPLRENRFLARIRLPSAAVVATLGVV